MDQKKVQQLQMVEQNMQNILQQKQAFQAQQVEIDNALEETKKSEGETYKILGTVMVASKKEDIIKGLEEKKKVVDLRIQSLDKQESQLKEKAESLQKEATK